MSEIKWNDPDLDLDEIIGIPVFDEIYGLTTKTSSEVINLRDLDLDEVFIEDTFLLYNHSKVVGAISYEKGEIINLKYLASINYHKNKYESDTELNHFIDRYFDKNDVLEIPGIGKELLKRFISKFKEDTEIEITSLNEASNFYVKILTELEQEGKIFFEKKLLVFNIVVL